jgi:hypothetical protein
MSSKPDKKESRRQIWRRGSFLLGFEKQPLVFSLSADYKK